MGARTIAGTLGRPIPVKFAKITGESPRDKTGRKVIGEKRMKTLQKAAKNYNRRLKYRIKKYYGETNWDNVRALRRAEDRNYITDIDLSKVTNIKRYNALLKELNKDLTKPYKAEMTNKRRDWMMAMAENGYYVDLTQFPELYDAIMHMSADDVLRWETIYSDLVKDIGYHYKIHDMATHDELWMDELDKFIASVAAITGKKLPSARVSLGLE